MGCNSHITVEVKDTDYPSLGWQCWAEHVMESRCYDLYAAMAGVRGFGPEPKGMPLDRSLVSKCFHDEHSEHSITWLTPKEYAEAYNAAGMVVSKEWEAILKCLFVLEEVFGEGNVRMIIGFDN